MSNLIVDRVTSIRHRILQLHPDNPPQLMAVTKGHSREDAMVAVAAGVDLIGENKVQEAQRKWGTPPPCPLHFIGHLQTNKVKYAIEIFNAIESIDSHRLANAINEKNPNHIMPVMIEVNMGRESQKYGLLPEEVLPFLESAHSWPFLKFAGLMAVFPNRLDNSQEEIVKIRKFMQETGELWRICRNEGFPWAPLHDLSMGMSGDFEWAVEAGATIVRIGTAIFGPRHGSRLQ